MPSLLEKIEASAAKRLTLPPGTTPAQELARYRNFLKIESHRLRILHRGGGSGLEVCRARAAVLDSLLRHLLQALLDTAPTPASATRVSLVAIGGYGRAELNPQSDVDIMFLHDGSLSTPGKTHPFLTLLTDGLLWDIGLKVGHSVRSLDDCVRVANQDMQSKTSLIESRLVLGDATLFKNFQKTLVSRCVNGHENAYIEARIQDQATRREKFGNSALMQEPNIKNGCGGLRDFQNLLWMSFFKYRTRSLADLEQRELISAAERRQLENAYDFLLRARNDLHYHVNRPVDVLHKAVQPSIAHNLGYTERSPSRRIEQFMRDLYTHLRNIHLITRTLEQRLALLPQPRRLPTFRQFLRNRRERAQYPIDGFKCIEGEIYPATPRVFRDQPRRLMRVFLLAQQRGLRLHPNTVQLVRNHLALVNRDFINDPHVHQTFLEILNQRGNVAPILRAMHEVGFLGKFIPEFGRLTCLVQHEFFHQYTADEHTLVCLERLDDLWHNTNPSHTRYNALFQELERPFVLYLALLIHDAGKAGKPTRDRNHSESGAKLATRIARRLGLDGTHTHSFRLLVEHHLDMAQVSQKRDLDDPSVIQAFALTIQTPEHLHMLTLLTLADSTGTSAQLWNGFKDSLLWSLHSKTLQLLSGGTDFLRAEERQRTLLTEEIQRIAPGSYSTEEIQAHFQGLPTRYFTIHNARQIFNDLTLAHRFMHLQIAEEDRALDPVVQWHNEPDRGYASVHVCTWDRSGLFSKITGTLTAAGLNILGAQIFSRSDGIILDTFFVTDARMGGLPAREEKQRFEDLLHEVLTQGTDPAIHIARMKPVSPLYQSIGDEHLPTRIAIDNDASEHSTLIDVETEDRVGLLSTITQTLSDLELNIALAKICTEKGGASDTFYVTELDGSKVRHPDRIHAIERTLQKALTNPQTPSR